MSKSTTLDYKGTPIEAIGDHLSLTDMWRASGSAPAQQPANWRSLPKTREFVDRLAERLIPGKSGDAIFKVVRGGKNPHTTAHWQAAMAYAQYLSPDFHMWCNTVVREFMEGRLVPVDAATASSVLTTLDQDQQRILKPVIDFMEEAFSRVFAEQRDIRQLVNGVKEQIEELRVRVPQRRREIKPDTRQRHIAVLIQLGGRCPCCSVTPVVSDAGAVIDGAEFDHYYANQFASDDHTWLICKSCHDALTTQRMSRAEATPHFMSFQIRRKNLSGVSGSDQDSG